MQWATQVVAEQVARHPDPAQLRWGTHRPISAKDYLRKMSEGDNVEAYLHTFERVAEREKSGGEGDPHYQVGSLLHYLLWRRLPLVTDSAPLQ
ncbi:hypothetical protein AAFF_G00005860 [Aldrovandia affinis]|uniref:Uncharacterized protein n=1 Tax=Aldrovandia affinis TaxID=143900 RepID=A0AAD7TDU3_9TELE|nr:hypothetical protein AAFF_G00005860 [Aldrovandia affinis]